MLRIYSPDKPEQIGSSKPQRTDFTLKSAVHETIDNSTLVSPRKTRKIKEVTEELDICIKNCIKFGPPKAVILASNTAKKSSIVIMFQNEPENPNFFVFKMDNPESKTFVGDSSSYGLCHTRKTDHFEGCLIHDVRLTPGEDHFSLSQNYQAKLCDISAVLSNLKEGNFQIQRSGVKEQTLKFSLPPKTVNEKDSGALSRFKMDILKDINEHTKLAATFFKNAYGQVHLTFTRLFDEAEYQNLQVYTHQDAFCRVDYPLLAYTGFGVERNQLFIVNLAKNEP